MSESEIKEETVAQVYPQNFAIIMPGGIGLPAPEQPVKKRGRPKKNVSDTLTTTISVGSKKHTGPGTDSQPETTKKKTNHRDVEVDNIARVAGTWGITKSLGNYEFARMDVQIEHYCDKGKEAEKIVELEQIACDYLSAMNMTISDRIFNAKKLKDNVL